MKPLEKLAVAMRSAANNIESGEFRRIAARDAEKIPKSRVEISCCRKGQMAHEGRTLLASLQALPPDEFPDAVERLRHYADAITSSFEVISETSAGDRRRSAAA